MQNFLKFKSWGPRDSTTVQALALHAANLGLISGTAIVSHVLQGRMPQKRQD